MKSFALSAAVAALLFAAPAALAQDHHDKGQSGGHAGAAHPGGGHAGAAHPSGGGHGGGAPHAAPAAAPAAPAARAGHNSGGMHGPASAPAVSGHGHNGHSGHGGIVTTTASPAAVYNNAVRNNNKGRGNNNYGGKSNNNSHNGNHNNFGNNNRSNVNVRVNFNRRNVTAQHHYRYRGGAYRGPSGYSYRRWAYGQTLPSIYFASSYWINDYSDYGLAYPPTGCVWVRYGNDAILIDRDSGEILEVVYGQFY